MTAKLVYLKTEQAALSKKTGAPVTELIRRAIDAYLKEKKPSNNLQGSITFLGKPKRREKSPLQSTSTKYPKG